MKFQIETNCICGNFRSNNEDAIAYGEIGSRQLAWMVIADGMGGHQAGEVASGMFIEMSQQAFSEITDKQKVDWKLWLGKLVQKVNQQVYQKANSSSEHTGMGTTGVVFVVCAGKFYLAWVGDSRGYLWHQGELTQLTVDHSAVQMLLDKGAITAQEAARSNTKHILARAIGVKAKVAIDVVVGELSDNDIVLLSTDGLHDVVPEEELQQYLTDFQSGKEITEELTQKALKLGSKDNITFGMLKMSAK